MASNEIFNDKISKIISMIEKENEIFSNKSALDSLSLPSKILGRNKQIEAIIRLLLSYRYGHVVPFISVYGRTGSGKTVIIQHVCSELKEVDYVLVNLRRTHSVFGAINLILADLGLDTVKGSQGAAMAFGKMAEAIKLRLEKNSKKLFVMILDEFDMIFEDKRGRPSNFVYKLIELEKDLTKAGLYICIIGISNNILSEYDVDDRVKSRIGSSEIFFPPYGYDHVLSILRDRAQDAFATKIDDAILQHCADLASEEHGDARRAIDLLRVAAEHASVDGVAITMYHVDEASRELQKDRVENVIRESSYQFKRTLAAIARITFLSEQDWHYTSTIVQQYRKVWVDGVKLLSYRRVSDILGEIQNAGLLVSQESSRGRHGYGKQYKLKISPMMAGRLTSPGWWRELIKIKDLHIDRINSMKKEFANSAKERAEIEKNQTLERMDDSWNNYVWQERYGLDELE